jgi:hypothetical protein
MYSWEITQEKKSVSRHSYEWLQYGGHYDMVVSTRFFTIILHTTKSCNIFMSYTVYKTWSLNILIDISFNSLNQLQRI